MTPPISVDLFVDAKYDRDIDSSAKLLLDVLQQVGVYTNDMKICHLGLDKPPDRTIAPKSDTIVVNVISLGATTI
jgi:Holliday junction resolvase RusA-like endonuclease